MGTVVVGYVATPEGTAALNTAVAEATARSVPLVVILSERGQRFGIALQLAQDEPLQMP